MGSNLSSNCSCESASRVLANDEEDARPSLVIEGGCSQAPRWAAVPSSPERDKVLQTATVQEDHHTLPSRYADVRMFPSQAVPPSSRFLEYSVVFSSSRKIKLAEEEVEANAIWRSEEPAEETTPQPADKMKREDKEEEGIKMPQRASGPKEGSEKDGALRARGKSPDSSKELNADLARPNSLPVTLVQELSGSLASQVSGPAALHTAVSKVSSSRPKARSGQSPTRVAARKAATARAPSPDTNKEQAVLKALCKEHGLSCSIKWKLHGTDSFNTEVLDMDVGASYPGSAPEFCDKSSRCTFTIGKGMIGRVWDTKTKELIPNVKYLDAMTFSRKEIALACKIQTTFAIYANNAVYEFDTTDELWQMPFESKDVEKAFTKAKSRPSMQNRQVTA